MSQHTLELSESNFGNEVLSSKQPVLVDFWAGWCGPCRAMAPTLDLVAKEVEGQAKVGKVDIDQSPALAERFGIRSIPTLILFQDGVEVDRIIGAASGGVLKEKLEALASAA